MKKLIFNITILFLFTGCMSRNTNPQPALLISAEEIIVAFKNYGLPVAAYKIYSEETDPDQLLGKINQCISKASFFNPAVHDIKEFPSNIVEVFANEKDAEDRHDTLMDLSSASRIKSQILYLNGVYLLRLSNEISQKDAKKYIDIFQELVEKRVSGPKGSFFCLKSIMINDQ